MKDVLSLTTFAIGALCFVVFVTTVKPDAISADPASSKPDYSKLLVSKSAWGPDADRRAKLLIYQAMVGQSWTLIYTG